MIEKFKPFKNQILTLMCGSFLVSFFGGQDAIKSTILYNNLDLENDITIKIVDKSNKQIIEGIFPDLHFKGVNLTTNKLVEINVSKGDYDSSEIGQSIKVYKTRSNEFLTEYEIDNQVIIHMGGIGYSFFIIPSVIFLMIGMFCLFVLLKLRKRIKNYNITGTNYS